MRDKPRSKWTEEAGVGTQGAVTSSYIKETFVKQMLRPKEIWSLNIRSYNSTRRPDKHQTYREKEKIPAKKMNNLKSQNLLLVCGRD